MCLSPLKQKTLNERLTTCTFAGERKRTGAFFIPLTAPAEFYFFIFTVVFLFSFRNTRMFIFFLQPDCIWFFLLWSAEVVLKCALSIIHLTWINPRGLWWETSCVPPQVVNELFMASNLHRECSWASSSVWTDAGRSYRGFCCYVLVSLEKCQKKWRCSWRPVKINKRFFFKSLI